MEKLHWLDQIQPFDRTLVGDKAFSLSRVIQRGYPVVPGFVVPATAARQFLESIQWSAPLGLDLPYSSLHLDVDNPRQLQSVAQTIRQEITAATLPSSWMSEIESAQAHWQTKVLILRPSLALDPASKVQATGVLLPESGLLESHVCLATPESLAMGLKLAWAELFRARSLFYWHCWGIQTAQLNLAILVQPVLDAIASGTLQATPECWEIQSTWGLGKALVLGEVVPDFYQVQPETGEVQTRYLGSKTRAYRLENFRDAQTNTNSTENFTNTHPSRLRVDNCLEAYLLNEEQQNYYALEEKHLDVLIQLAKQLRTELGPTFTLEWTLSPGKENEGNQLYLTQVIVGHSAMSLKESKIKVGAVKESLQHSVEIGHSSLMLAPLSFFSPQTQHRLQEGKVPTVPEPDLKPLIEGLGASAGRTIAIAHVLTDSNHLHFPDADRDENSPVNGKILVVKSITPDRLVLLKQAVAVVAEQGAMTCHAAIIARELGIPAVVGAVGATRLIQTGDAVLVDGDKGAVYRVEAQAGDREKILPHSSLSTPHAALSTPHSGLPTPHAALSTPHSGLPTPHAALSTPRPSALSPQPSVLSPQPSVLSPQPSALSPQPSVLSPQPSVLSPQPSVLSPQSSVLATQLLVNLSQPSSIKRAAQMPVDGVGLLRSELMLLEVLQGQHPQRWLQQQREDELREILAQQLCQFAEAFAPRPVFYRSLDLRSHEFQYLVGGSLGHPEANPMLGMRGTFSYVSNPALFDVELAALVRVQQLGYTNVRLLLPFVRTVEEFSFCRRRVEQAGLSQSPQFQLWIVAEVPSVLFLLPDYVKAGVQGISIGTNDLTQLLLGVDRDQAQMAAAFDERHPAVTQAIAQLIQMAKQAGIPCCICGQAPAQYPELIDRLVQWGIPSISVELDAVERTYNAIARAEQRLLLAAARRQLNQ
ncbi:phosphoenolpyruvate synthase [Coleofasciculus sp. FACHB-64]|uniref:putative PEP-binding protein n=1 Tax=Cyanophyceae TaxID=3028117 RepID=UPI0016857172|nr:phosphoenolpyruvate synthase [Coleofasciculus sp. FACHB-64]